MSEQPEILPYPPVPFDLLKRLQTDFPDRIPDSSKFNLDQLIGEQRVIRKLQQQLDLQTKTVLETP